MSKKIFDAVKSELKHLGFLLVVVFVLLKIVYLKEEIVVAARMALSLFWMFALPGYIIMLHWKENLDFAERIIVGIALSAALMGILSYYLGLLGIAIKYHAALLPALTIILGLVLAYRKSSSWLGSEPK